MKKPTPQVGDIVLASSFCTCEIHAKLKKEAIDGWWAYVTRKQDVKCLNKMGVPLALGEETFVFDFEIIKIIKKKPNYRRKRRTKND